MDKLIGEDVQSVTVSTGARATVRQNGYYLLGSAEGSTSTGFDLQANINEEVDKRDNIVLLEFVVSSKHANSTNNAPVGIVFGGFTINFN